MAQAPKPKKKDQAPKEERPFLGKLEKNHCRIGIVGLPNIGKSSFFNYCRKNKYQQKTTPSAPLTRHKHKWRYQTNGLTI